MTTQLEADQGKTEKFLVQAVTDMAAAESSALMYVGEKFGLYRAMVGFNRSRRAAETPFNMALEARL